MKVESPRHPNLRTKVRFSSTAPGKRRAAKYCTQNQHPHSLLCCRCKQTTHLPHGTTLTIASNSVNRYSTAVLSSDHIYNDQQQSSQLCVIHAFSVVVADAIVVARCSSWREYNCRRYNQQLSSHLRRHAILTPLLTGSLYHRATLYCRGARW